MRMALSPGRRLLLLGASLLIVLAYVGFALTDYLAARFSERTDLTSLQRAVRLQPWNAEYRDHLGRYFFLQENSADDSVQSYLSAVSLNPHQARYWIDLANAYQVQGAAQPEEDALEHALRAGPTSTAVAWDAANLYSALGDTSAALREFRTVLEHDPYLRRAANRDRAPARCGILVKRRWCLLERSKDSLRPRRLRCSSALLGARAPKHPPRAVRRLALDMRLPGQSNSVPDADLAKRQKDMTEPIGRRNSPEGRSTGQGDRGTPHSTAGAGPLAASS